MGTEKVIRDHSTIGIVMTTDGSFGEIPRSRYLDAEEKTINTLKQIKKPFVVIVNTVKHIRIFKGKKIFCNMKLVLQEEGKQTDGEAGL